MSSGRATIGDYVVTSKLGSGSFAVVYKGYHKVTKAPVAIKALSLSKLNRKLLANLELEIAIMRQIDHPNVVKLYEIKKTEKHMYLVLEYCAGGDLQQFMRRFHHQQQQQSGPSSAASSSAMAAPSASASASTSTSTPLPEGVARHFLRQLAQGVHCLWRHHLIHRDLKPQNLLLAEDSATATLKIADFGFARPLASTSLAETLCGSPLYMAPEILKFQKYDAKADLWSVGTILFELVVGRPPYGGANHVQLLANIERSELRIPADVALSPDCRALLVGLLQRRPASRLGFDEFFRHPFVGMADAVDAVDAGSSHSSAVGRLPPMSIREEDDAHDAANEATALGSSSGHDSQQLKQQPSVSKTRAVSESGADATAAAAAVAADQSESLGSSPAVATQTNLRSSRSGNMEVLQNVFGSTSATASGTYTGSAALRRSSRLGRSRRATSSGAILATPSPKRSPQMSPNVLPSPGPRINPFKQEMSVSPPPLAPTGSRAGTSPSSVRAKPIVHHPPLDSSGEYVMVECGADRASPAPSSSPRHGAASQHTSESSTKLEVSHRSLDSPTATSPPVHQTLFSAAYAHQLVEITTLRTQAIAPIADQLWSMSAPAVQLPDRGSAHSNSASLFSLSSSSSSSVGGLSAADASVVMEKKQYVYAAEALTLYVKCMRMIQHALLYLRQDPALSPHAKAGPALSLPDPSRKISMAFLVEQLNAFLNRADECKKRMHAFLSSSRATDVLRTLVVTPEELLYSHAIRLGKEGAIKEVLGQSRAAYELYLQALLLLESMLHDAGGSPSSSPMNSEDQDRVRVFVQGLETRLKAVQQLMDEEEDAPRRSGTLAPSPTPLAT
ncbi:hypothetical protein P43SY_008398 [Pythium insidiosum]|uniref:Protein kinase domain-containing protein n=1 Tax=Pythium insidiosum TaxID=114742 RepID=A0AAD5M357_PYTIN|nr:hypothetical protein P43SY_008398 [Pythium insidiosum]